MTELITQPVMAVRNPTYNARGTIDCEVEHPEFGWIPFTATPHDDVQFGRDLYAAFIAGDHGEVVAYAPPTLTTAQTLALIAAKRYEQEVSGITVMDMAVDTGRDSQGLIAGAALAAVIDNTYSVRWKCASNTFITLDATQIIGLASAVRAHVQACFDREAELSAAVTDGTFTLAMLEEGWPA